MHVTFLLGLIVPASYDEYTALVKNDNCKQTRGKQSRVRIAGYRDLLSYVTFLLDMWPVLCCFFFGTMKWCSCASVVIFLNSVVINSLSSFSVPFSVISMLRSARCMSLLSV